MNNITSSFNAAAAGPTGEAGTVSSGPSPTGPASPTSPFVAAAEAPSSSPSNPIVEPALTITVESVEAELHTLEAGRPRPTPRHNLNPPRTLKKIVDSQTERQREARIKALKAYTRSRGHHVDHELWHDQGGDLGFGL